MNILRKFLKDNNKQKFGAYRKKNINLSLSRNISPHVINNQIQALPEMSKNTLNKLSETFTIGLEEN